MRYVINISPKYEKKISRLIKKGVVLSIDHFVEVAIRNQLLLEADEIKISSTSMKKSQRKTQRKEKYQKKYDLNNFIKRDNLHVTSIESKIAEEYQNSLIWGQIYRIFPIKFNLRVLANIFDNGVTRVLLEDFKEKISDLAYQQGKKLREIDEMMSRKRGNKLATGFPTDVYGKLAKSRERYFTHYVGGINTKLESEGCLVQLGLVEIRGDGANEPYIQITNPGLDFALSENPILDLQQYQDSLATTEISQYINSIRVNLPLELKHMIYFLSSIESGINERDALNERMREFYSQLPSETVKWESLQVVNTMRTGLTSRMVELGFIEIQYIKQRAIYKVKKGNWRNFVS